MLSNLSSELKNELDEQMKLHFSLKKYLQLEEQVSLQIKYLDVGPQAQLPPPYAKDISALQTMVSS